MNNSPISVECIGPRRALRDRAGYTLIELIVSLGSAAILMGGLASSLLIANQALTTDASASADANRGAQTLAQLNADLRHALRVTERTARTVAIEVPDRTGDGTPESIRYSWSGAAGDPLYYQYNGGAPVAVAANVQAFNLQAMTRLIRATTLDPPTVHYIVYEAFTEAKAPTDVQSLAIAAPAGAADGKLLIAAVAIDGGGVASLTAPAGWNPLLAADSSGQVGLAVWWKIATNAEPASYAFNWLGPENAYGWIMRFSGINPAGPINAYATAIGASSSPQCPALNTTYENAMILRVGGFDGDSVNIDSPGIALHTAITMDESNASSASASGGAAYVPQPAPGASGTANFSLTSSEEFVTATIAIVPYPPD